MKILSCSLAVACVFAAFCPNPKNMNEQHDYNYNGVKVDFEKPIEIPLPVPDKTPERPVCSLYGGDLRVVEVFQDDKDKAKKEDPGGWSCKVTNRGSQDYIIRVQSTMNHDNPAREAIWDFYYYIPKATANGPTNLLANPGHGGEKMVCRLCGAVPANDAFLTLAEGSKKDWNAMGPLEWSTYGFQCRQRCTVVLYQHRNFNGKQLTITSNTRSLLKGQLVNDKGTPLVSSLKIFGRDCQVRFWEKPDYQYDDTLGVAKPVFKDDTPAEVCEITSQYEIEAWDMDALRKRCCSPRCKSGQDCFQSVGIRDKAKCGPSNAGKGATCKGCRVAGRNSMVTASAVTPAQSRVEKLERLFKAMANVLEE